MLSFDDSLPATSSWITPGEEAEHLGPSFPRPHGAEGMQAPLHRQVAWGDPKEHVGFSTTPPSSGRPSVSPMHDHDDGIRPANPSFGHVVGPRPYSMYDPSTSPAAGQHAHHAVFRARHAMETSVQYAAATTQSPGPHGMYSQGDGRAQHGPGMQQQQQQQQQGPSHAYSPTTRPQAGGGWASSLAPGHAEVQQMFDHALRLQQHASPPQPSGGPYAQEAVPGLLRHGLPPEVVEHMRVHQPQQQHQHGTEHAGMAPWGANGGLAAASSAQGRTATAASQLATLQSPALAGPAARDGEPQAAAAARHGARAGDGEGATASAAAASAELERARAVVMQLERVNMELQRRVVAMQEAAQEAERRREVAEEREREQCETLQQAEARLQQREAQVVLAQRHADAAVQELRNCQQELLREQEKVAAGRDEVAQLQDRCADLSKQLELSHKKMGYLGQDDRRLQSELMQLRKEHGEMQELVHRTKADSADLRQRLAHSEADAVRLQREAAHALAEGGGAAAQLHALRSRVADLEARNAQLEARSKQGSQPASDADRGLPYPSDSGANPAYVPANKRNSLGGPAGAGGRGSQAYGPAAGVPGSRGESMKTLLYNDIPGVGYSPYAEASRQLAYSPPPQQQQQQRPQQQQQQPVPRQEMSVPSYDYLLEDAGRLPGYRAAGAGVGRVGSWDGPPAAAWDAREPAPQPLASRPLAEVPPAYGRLGPAFDAAQERSAGAGRSQPSPQPAAAPPSDAYYGGPPKQASHSNHEYLRRSIEERLQSLQAAEDVIRTRLAAQDAARPMQRPADAGPGPGLPRSQGHPGGVPMMQGWMEAGEAASRACFEGNGGEGQHRAEEPYVGLHPSSSAAGGPGQAHHTRSPAAHGTDLPFGTDTTAKDMLARSKHLEDALVQLCWERAQLEAELGKLPAGSGRNIKERRRKAEVEQRLGALNREISATRSQLKKITGK